MKSISTAQCSSIISFLNEGYSHHQIQARTGLRKGTVGRISKEWDGPLFCPKIGQKPEYLFSWVAGIILAPFQQVSQPILFSSIDHLHYLNLIVCPSPPKTVQKGDISSLCGWYHTSIFHVHFLVYFN